MTVCLDSIANGSRNLLRGDAERRLREKLRLDTANSLLVLMHPDQVQRMAKSLPGGKDYRLQFLDMVESINLGYAEPQLRRVLEKEISTEAMHKMFGILNGTEEAKRANTKGMNVNSLMQMISAIDSNYILDPVGESDAFGDGGSNPEDFGASVNDEAYEYMLRENVSTYAKSAAEKSSARGSGPRVYGGAKAPTLRGGDSRVDPFAPLKKMTATELQNRELENQRRRIDGRPQLSKSESSSRIRLFPLELMEGEKLPTDFKPDNNDLPDRAEFKKRMAAMEKELNNVDVNNIENNVGDEPGGSYVIKALSASQVMKDLGVVPSKILSIYRDYLARDENAGLSKEGGADLVRSALYNLAARKTPNEKNLSPCDLSGNPLEQAQEQRRIKAQREAKRQEDAKNHYATAEASELDNDSLLWGISINREDYQSEGKYEVAKATLWDEVDTDIKQKLQDAKEYFDRHYLAVGESMADNVPEKLQRGVVSAMSATAAKDMKGIEGAAYKAVGNRNSKEYAETVNRLISDSNYLMFVSPDGEKSIPIKARNIVNWARSQRDMYERDNEPRKGEFKPDKRSVDEEYLGLLLSGINSVLESGYVQETMPWKRNKIGRTERFKSTNDNPIGIPPSLGLATMTFGDLMFRKNKVRASKAEAQKAFDEEFVGPQQNIETPLHGPVQPPRNPRAICSGRESQLHRNATHCDSHQEAVAKDQQGGEEFFVAEPWIDVADPLLETKRVRDLTSEESKALKKANKLVGAERTAAIAALAVKAGALVRADTMSLVEDDSANWNAFEKAGERKPQRYALLFASLSPEERCRFNVRPNGLTTIVESVDSSIANSRREAKIVPIPESVIKAIADWKERSAAVAFIARTEMERVGDQGLDAGVFRISAIMSNAKTDRDDAVVSEYDSVSKLDESPDLFTDTMFRTKYGGKSVYSLNSSESKMDAVRKMNDRAGLIDRALLNIDGPGSQILGLNMIVTRIHTGGRVKGGRQKIRTKTSPEFVVKPGMEEGRGDFVGGVQYLYPAAAALDPKRVKNLVIREGSLEGLSGHLQEMRANILRALITSDVSTKHKLAVVRLMLAREHHAKLTPLNVDNFLYRNAAPPSEIPLEFFRLETTAEKYPNVQAMKKVNDEIVNAPAVIFRAIRTHINPAGAQLVVPIQSLADTPLVGTLKPAPILQPVSSAKPADPIASQSAPAAPLITNASSAERDWKITETQRVNLDDGGSRPPNFDDEQTRINQANVFISAGSEKSFQRRYIAQAKAAGMPVNPGNYSASDVVYVSAEALRSGCLFAPRDEIEAAVAVGATIVIPAFRYDTLGHGNVETARVLVANGYKEGTQDPTVDTADGWWRPSPIAHQSAPTAPLITNVPGAERDWKITETQRVSLDDGGSRPPNFNDEQTRINLATAFISAGSEHSFQKRYMARAKAAGLPVNPGKYSARDVVYISAEIQRQGRHHPADEEVLAAIEVGATIVTPVSRGDDLDFGNAQVARLLMKNSYVEGSQDPRSSDALGWWRPVENSANGKRP